MKLKDPTYNGNHRALIHGTDLSRAGLAERIHNERVRQILQQLMDRGFVVKGLVIALLISIGGMIYAFEQRELVPYVIKVNESGEVVTVGRLVRPSPVIEDRTKEWFVRQWIEYARARSSDPGEVERQKWWVYYNTEAYVYGAHRTYFNEHILNARLPLNNPQRQIIRVHVTRVTPLDSSIYHVEWSEETFSAAGKSQKAEEWVAAVKINDQWDTRPFQQQTAAKDQNPLGIRVRELSWREK